MRRAPAPARITRTCRPAHPSPRRPRAKQSFLDSADWAYTGGIVAVLLGAALVFFLFSGRDAEQRLLRRSHAEDAARAEGAPDRSVRGRLMRVAADSAPPQGGGGVTCSTGRSSGRR